MMSQPSLVAATGDDVGVGINRSEFKNEGDVVTFVAAFDAELQVEGDFAGFGFADAAQAPIGGNDLVDEHFFRGPTGARDLWKSAHIFLNSREDS